MPRNRDLSLDHVETNKLSLSLRTEREVTFKIVYRISMCVDQYLVLSSMGETSIGLGETLVGLGETSIGLGETFHERNSLWAKPAVTVASLVSLSCLNRHRPKVISL